MLERARHQSRDEAVDLKSALELQKQLDEAKAEAKLGLEKLEEVGKFLVELSEELSSSMDPISMQPMKDPVLAADLHTYDRESIEAWHKVRPISPLTRAPLQIVTLRSNKVASWLADANVRVTEVCKKFWPGKAVSAPVPRAREVLPVHVGAELLEAIKSGDEDSVIELLSRPIDNRYLNGMYTHGGGTWSLLELALIRHLPRAAGAVAARPDFRRGNMANGGVFPIHRATALGYEDACRSLLNDCGPEILKQESERTATMELADGTKIILPAWKSCWDLARLFKHTSLLELFDKVLAGQT